MRGSIRQNLNMLASVHRPGVQPNVFIHSLPRSGSTWLMELILSQPGFRRFNEPLNLRKPFVRENLGIGEWAQLHEANCTEKLESYFARLCSGELRDARYNFKSPFSRNYRPFTWRTVFKIINGGHEHVHWLAEALNGRVVLLLRHPIPVAQSRKSFPELDAILRSDLVEQLSGTQRSIADAVARDGTKLAKGVLDWCLRNAVALRERKPTWSVVTYEQLVLDPVPAVFEMSRKLELPSPEKMLRRLKVPSRSFKQSTPETRQVLQSDRSQDKEKWLVEKWKSDVSADELRRCDEIISAFGLGHVYRIDDAIPRMEFWIDQSEVVRRES
jgi:uncharacterized protein YbaR (Trm112 family)